MVLNALKRQETDKPLKLGSWKSGSRPEAGCKCRQVLLNTQQTSPNCSPIRSTTKKAFQVFQHFQAKHIIPYMFDMC